MNKPYVTPWRRIMNSLHFICNHLESFCRKIVSFFIYAILFFSLLSFLVCVIVFCKKHGSVFSVWEFFWLIPAVFLLLGIFRLANFLQKKSEHFFIFFMVATEIAIAMFMIFSYDTWPCSDYAAIWISANEMARGIFVRGTNPADYMYCYNWQLGIAAFESLIIRLGGNFFTLKILNSCLLMLLQFLEYRLVKSKFGPCAASYAYVLSTLFMPWCLTIPQFTNHHIGCVLLLFGLFLLDQYKLLSWIAAGVLLAMMNVLRPLGIIVLLSAGCLTIYSLLQKRHIKPLLLFCGLLISYTLVIALFDSLFIALGYTDANISQARIPYFKFQKGLYAYDTPADDLKTYDYNYDTYNAAMKEELIDVLQTKPLQTVVFIANKMVRYLGLFDYQFEMTYNHDVAFYTQYPVKALYSTSWFQYIGVLILALIGYQEYRKRAPVDIYQIFFIGNTLVYIFIEAFSSYRFESYCFLLMWAALGYKRCAEAEKHRILLKAF